jgi:ParB family chromosome partitioning protein
MTEKRKVLGRGLETLLPNRQIPHPANAAAAPAPAQAQSPADVVHWLSVDGLDRNPYQTRRKFEETSMRELAASIQELGVLQPITVRPAENGRYEVMAGERRWLASRLAGKPTVPAIVRQVSNEQAMEMTIIENLQREDLNAMEQARAYERLGREFGLTQEQMAQRTGKDRSSVANFLRILRLPPLVQKMIEENELSFGHGKILVSLETQEEMERVAQRIRAQELSVRQTEEAVSNMVQPRKTAKKAERDVDPNVREAEEQMQRALGAKVVITDRGGKGKILIEYASLEDFDRILEVMTGE